MTFGSRVEDGSDEGAWGGAGEAAEPWATLGPPWGKDHRMALAATIMAG